jgi:glycosyltransferase involved in cell wall biosynthesis
MNKKKILVIADSPLAPSGVGTQTKYMIEGMLRTGEFSFVCLAGALKHEDYQPVKVDPYAEDWIIHPVDGYGNPDIVRQMISHYKPDVLWFMTDPRFYTWLWNMEDEIRPNVPMVYYHVWDNYPYPKFNKAYYDSNDVVCTISKVTDDIVRNVSPDVKCVWIPHTVDTSVFKKREEVETASFARHAKSEGKMVFFWNNRNARRKQSGTLIFWFKEFLERIGKDKAMLIMHTEPKDPNGQDLQAIINTLGLNTGQVIISTNKVSPQDLSCLYGISDCTINISDAEGFGLSTLESLACEVPIIVNMTGGLQEQVTDGEKWFGIGLEPTAKSVIGSQEVPYIYEDRLNKGDFVDALEEFYNKSKEERAEMGRRGREHVLKNYGMPKYAGLWYQTFKEIFEEFGSWEDRKNYKSWEMFKI